MSKRDAKMDQGEQFDAHMDETSMIRGAMPLMWLVLVGILVLRLSSPSVDIPEIESAVAGGMGDIMLGVMFLTLLVSTVYIGLPSLREAICSTLTGLVAATAIMLSTALLAGVVSFLVLLVIQFFLIIPSSFMLFRILMKIGRHGSNSPNISNQ